MLAVSILLLGGFFAFAFSQARPEQGAASVKSFTQIDQSSGMRKGSADAKVSFIQYSDFLCPSCSYVSTSVVPKIEQTYISTGKVQFEFRPMAFIAEGSVLAGMGAYCAVDQNKFWQYHDAIYAYVADKILNKGMDPQRDEILTSDRIKLLAKQASLSPEFDTCLDSKKHLADIQNSTTTANRNGINGTPYLLINGKHVTGNPSLDTVESMIKVAL